MSPLETADDAGNSDISLDGSRGRLCRSPLLSCLHAMARVYWTQQPMSISGAPLNASELAIIFGYKNKRGVNRAARIGLLPVPTYMHNGLRFAHADHVNAWLELKKIEAETEFNEWE